VGTLEVAREQLYDVGETGMLRLLPHVRCAFLCMDQFEKEMSCEQIRYASRFACFYEMLRCAFEVQSGRRDLGSIGSRGMCRRDSFGFFRKDDITETWMRVLNYCRDLNRNDSVSANQERGGTSITAGTSVAAKQGMGASEVAESKQLYCSEDLDVPGLLAELEGQTVCRSRPRSQSQ
jgi:hypothetical protein